MRHMNFLSLSLFSLLAACATPQERCLADATSAYDGILKAKQEAQANIARGYAIHRQLVPYQYNDICYGDKGRGRPCITTRYRTIETPVAIDFEAERAKVAQYDAQLPELRRTADAQAAQCRIIYPE